MPICRSGRDVLRHPLRDRSRGRCALNTPETVGMFKLFAELIAFHLDAQERLARSEAALVDERADRRAARAVHRGPRPRPAQSARRGRGRDACCCRGSRSTSKREIVVGLMQRQRQAHGRPDRQRPGFRARPPGRRIVAATGLPTEPLEPMLDQVVAELRAAWPDRVIETHFALAQPVDCDRGRIGQLFSNLLANALTHGAPDGPVRVSAAARDGSFELAVANPGEPDPARHGRPAVPAVLPRIRSDPSSRGSASGSTSPR